MRDQARSGEAASQPPVPPTSTADAPGPAPMVLVVDDDPTVRELMQHYLLRRGFAVETARDGAEALTRARELHPDAMTLDIMMPVADGWTVLAALKGDPGLADIPVVLVSILDEQNRGYALGAVDDLVKPIDRNRLLSTLNRICHARSKRLLVIDDDDALLDLMMPEMSGFEFLAEVRARAAWQHIPVVVVTAKDLTPEEKRELTGGVQRVLAKNACSREEWLDELNHALTELVGRSRVAGAQEAHT